MLPTERQAALQLQVKGQALWLQRLPRAAGSESNVDICRSPPVGNAEEPRVSRFGVRTNLRQQGQVQA